jgi:hypothetical protein
MGKKEITFKVTLELDEKWASNLSWQEVMEHIQEKVDRSLGFRGQVKKFSVVGGRTRKR